MAPSVLLCLQRQCVRGAGRVPRQHTRVTSSCVREVWGSAVYWRERQLCNSLTTSFAQSISLSLFKCLPHHHLAFSLWRCFHTNRLRRCSATATRRVDGILRNHSRACRPLTRSSVLPCAPPAAPTGCWRLRRTIVQHTASRARDRVCWPRLQCVKCSMGRSGEWWRLAGCVLVGICTWNTHVAQLVSDLVPARTTQRRCALPTAPADHLPTCVLVGCKLRRTKLDASPDTSFYSIPRLVKHVDDGFCAQLTQLYRERIPQGRAARRLHTAPRGERGHTYRSPARTHWRLLPPTSRCRCGRVGPVQQLGQPPAA